MKSFHVRSALAAGLLLTAAQAMAGVVPCASTPGNLVANCSFETGDFTGWAHHSPINNDFIFTASSAISATDGTHLAAFGDYVNNDGYVSQTLATTPGTLYSISFYLSETGGNPNQAVVSFGGTTLATFNNIPNSVPVKYSYIATATSASTVLTLSGASGPFFLYIDNVVVVPQASLAQQPPATTATAVYGQSGSFTTNTASKGGVGADSSYAPGTVTVDKDGGLYIGDQGNNRVLYYPAGGSAATRVYGQGGSFTTNTANKGGISASSLSAPNGLVVDNGGNLYVSDQGNHRILFYPAGATVATRVYGQGGSFSTGAVNSGGLSANSLNNPFGVALDNGGNLYVSDLSNARALYFPAGTTTATRVYGQGGSFTTGSANNGGISANSLYFPTGMVLDDANNLYLADAFNHRVLVFAAGATTATKVYGQAGSFTTNTPNSGGASATSLDIPAAVMLDRAGGLYVVDQQNSRALFYPAGATTATRVWGQSSSFTSTAANKGGVTAASLWIAIGGALDVTGNLYIADVGNNRVLKYAAAAPAASLAVTATHSTPIYQGGAGAITLTIANSGGATAAIATVTDNVSPAFTIGTVSPGCAVSLQTVTCTLAQGSTAASSVFTINIIAAANASTAGILNTATLTDSGDTISTGTSSDTITVSATQTITFGTLSNQRFGNGPVTLSATATSGLPVSFNSQTAAVCTVSGSLVTLVAAGSCAIQATQSGNSTWPAATPVNRSFTVSQTYYLTTSASGNGTISPASAYYDPGTLVQVTSVPGAGSYLIGYSVNGVASASTPLSVTMNATTKVGAAFGNSVPFLTGSISTKASGTLTNERVWTFNLANTGVGSATNVKIANVRILSVKGSAGVSLSSAMTLPVSLGNIAQGATGSGQIRLIFPATTPVSTISIEIDYIGDNIPTAKTVVNNQFR